MTPDPQRGDVPRVVDVPRVLVAGVGNVFLADDGFGPAVVARLVRAPLPDGVRAVDYGIRGVHLSYDLLDGWDALVLVDAVPGDGRAGELRMLRVTDADLTAAPPPDAHSLHPLAVLSSLTVLGGRLPRTWVIGCVPLSLEEGMGLSAPVAAAVPRAADRVRALVGRPAVPARAGG